MAWTKAPQSLIDLFDACLPQGPGLERRRMFGQPCAFVNGNMFAGLLQDVAFARLPPGLHAELDAEFGVRHFEPMPGRPMRAYVVLPEEVLDDEGRYAEILQGAYAFTAALPPKAKKPRKPRKA
jgi:TfoX/Sxy family transcriptional regulator of competence genes